MDLRETLVAAVFGGPNLAHVAWPVEILALAAGQFAIGSIRLPGWARLRRKQMEEISGRLTLALTSLPSKDPRVSAVKGEDSTA